MNMYKVIIAVGFVLATIAAVALFWKNALIVSVVLLSLAYLKHIAAPLRNEFVWYVVVGLVGAGTEDLMVSLGGNPWTYSGPLISNVPLWLPLLWGVAGITMITLHEGIYGTDREMREPGTLIDEIQMPVFLTITRLISSTQDRSAQEVS